MKKIIPKLFIFLGLIVFSGLAILKIESNAFIYISFVWLIILGVSIKLAKTERKRLVAIYSGSVLLAFFLAEIYFSGLLGFRYEYADYQRDMIFGNDIEEHDVFGLAPSKNSKWTERLTYGDSVVFDAIQTIDSNGLRYTPGKLRDDASPILFFGCSFTFGAGLSDYQTLPYYFQAQDSGRFKAINMGYNGYGAHQMLALLEEKIEQEVLQHQIPKAAIYSAIPDHAFRGTSWSEEFFGPKYKLDDRGILTKKGVVSYNPSLKFKLLGKSHLTRRFLLRKEHSYAKNVDLLLAMIQKSSRLFTARYDAPFYCLLWDEMYLESGLYDRLLTQLKIMGVKVIEVRDILPDYAENPEKYLLYGDNHPNALANRLIAEDLNKLLAQ